MDSEAVDPLVLLVGLVIAVVGMLANSFVLAAIAGDKMMRGNSMYLLLANLAIADLLYLGGSVVTTVFVKHDDLYSRALWSYILQLAIFASICTNVAVCIERYVAVVHSLHFNRLFRPGRVVHYCIILWVLAAALYIPHYLRQKHNPAVCPQNESFTTCSTPEATCESTDPHLGPLGPPKCECILGYVRHGGYCIHHSDCPTFHETEAVSNISSFRPPVGCPKGFAIHSYNNFGNTSTWTAKGSVDGTVIMCWYEHPECPRYHYHCSMGANASTTFCCSPGGGRGGYVMAPDVCAAGGARIRSPIKWYWKVYKILDWVLSFLLPIVVLGVFYTLTCRRLWSGDARLRTTDAQGAAVDQKEDPHASSRRGVVRMLIICVVVFYVCYTFPSVVYLAETIVDDKPIVTDSSARFAAVLVVLASSVNPFVYTVLSKSFRARLRQMYPCRLSRVVSETPKSIDKSTSNTDSSK